MDYGLQFITLVHDAIRREEEELKQLESRSYCDVTSVCQFEEAWLQYAIVKHAIRQRIYPRLSAEFPCDKKRADLCFVDGEEHALAIVELKPGRRPNPQLSEGILDDCRKLSNLCNVPAKAQRYAIGIVCGTPSEIQPWEQTLTKSLQDAHIVVNRMDVPPDIPSNITGKVLRLVGLRVTAASALKAGA
jgi:hypothetical protein